jgi:hypothetical protein
VEVGFVGRVSPGAEDGSEVAAGGHAESMDKIARHPVVLLLHKNATAVGQHEGGDVDGVSLGVFARDCARLVVAGLASEGFSRFDPGEPLAGITSLTQPLNSCAKLHNMAGSPDMLTLPTGVPTALSRIAPDSLQACSVTSPACWNAT